MTLGTYTSSQASTALPALQQAAIHAMARRSGTAVVINVATGKVLAAYHPETAARRLALPGSAIKPFTLLAMLESGKISQQTAVMCNRSLTVAGHKLNCTHPNLKHPVDAATALAYSCNTYFTSMATRLTPAELRRSFLQDGFGSPSGLVRQDESGTVTLASTQAELQLQAIGEWGVRVTPLELLRVYQHLAQLSLQSDAKLAPLFDGLEGSASYGMARLAQPASSMKVAGKTGTSPVDEGAWRHAWFAGYAPADKPEIVLVVFLEKGHGPTDAAGVAREIFAAYAESREAGR
jgi:penicillin-binding protein 2